MLNAAGLRDRIARDRRVRFEPRLQKPLEALGLLEAAPERLEALAPLGSTPPAPLPLGEPGRLLLRRRQHGGLLARLRRGAYWGPSRPLRELAVTAALRRAGAPVPEPVVAVAWRIAGPWWAGATGTRFEEDTHNGLLWLREAPQGDRVLRAAAAAGAALRRFHEAGGRHPDLHLGNLLLRECGDEAECILVDLDRVRIGPPPGAGSRAREMARLYRSLRKHGVLERVGRRGCARFLAAYCDGDGDRALRAALRPHLLRARLGVGLHALHYRRTPPGGRP